MKTIQLENKISLIVEQKFLEFFGGFDVGEKLNSPFLREVKKRINSKNRKFVSHSDILKMYAKD